MHVCVNGSLIIRALSSEPSGEPVRFPCGAANISAFDPIVENGYLTPLWAGEGKEVRERR